MNGSTTGVDPLTHLFTDDPFSDQEDVKMTQEYLHQKDLFRTESDLHLHLTATGATYTLTGTRSVTEYCFVANRIEA